MIRDIEFRIPVKVSILSERRVYHPYGLHGGEDAACGKNIWIRRVKKGAQEEGDEAVEYREVNLGSKNTASMQPGERIIVNTPGGGGYGKAGEESKISQKKDHQESWRKGSLAQRQETAESSV